MASHGNLPEITAEQALRRPVESNSRFLSGAARPPVALKDLLGNLALGQQAYATILARAVPSVPEPWRGRPCPRQWRFPSQMGCKDNGKVLLCTSGTTC